MEIRGVSDGVPKTSESYEEGYSKSDLPLPVTTGALLSSLRTRTDRRVHGAKVASHSCHAKVGLCLYYYHEQ